MRRAFVFGVFVLCVLLQLHNTAVAAQKPRIGTIRKMVFPYPIRNIVVNSEGTRFAVAIPWDITTRSSSPHHVEVLTVDFQKVWTVTLDEQDGVYELAFTPDDQYLFVGVGSRSRGGYIGIYDAKSGKKIKQYDIAQNGAVARFAFSGDGSTLLFYGGRECHVVRKGNDWSNLQWVRTFTIKPFSDLSSMNLEQLSADGSLLYGAGGVVDIATGSIRLKRYHNLALIENILPTKRGQVVILGEEEASREGLGIFQVYGATANEKVFSSSPVFNGGYSAGALDGLERWLVLGDHMGGVTVVDMATWATVKRQKNVLPVEVDQVVFIPNGNIFLVFGDDVPMSGRSIIKVFSILK